MLAFLWFLYLHFRDLLGFIYLHHLFSVGKGSQGATTGNTDYLDASKSPVAGGGDTGSPRPGSATSSASSQPTGPRQQKPGHGQKKKKKKGPKGW